MENNEKQTEQAESIEREEQTRPVEQTKTEIKTKKQGSLKWKIYAVLALIAFGVGSYGYFWLQKTNDLRAEAIEVVERAKNYDVLLSKVEDELDRCEKFISQKEGDFGSFEYCKKYIDWTETLSASE